MESVTIGSHLIIPFFSPSWVVLKGKVDVLPDSGTLVFASGAWEFSLPTFLIAFASPKSLL